MLPAATVAFCTVIVLVATAGLKLTESVGTNVSWSVWVPAGRTVPIVGEKVVVPGICVNVPWFHHHAGSVSTCWDVSAAP